MQLSDENPPALRKFAAPALAWLVLLAACESPPDAEAAPTAATAEFGCGENSELRTELFGAITAEVDWSRDQVACESMRRPNAEGLRLRFSGAVAQQRLAIIIAIPDARIGLPDAELPSNITVSVEGSGRFFSTPGFASCWTDIISQEPLVGSDSQFVAIGEFYCVAPLGELNGSAAVTIPELSFVSIFNWGPQ